MKKLLIVAIAPALAVIAACGGSTDTGGSSNGGSGSSPANAVQTSFSTGSTSLGTVLTNPQGFTLYYFTPEKGSTIVCTGGCLSTWPALKASGAPSAPSGVTGTLGTAALPDGTMVVTYNGWPLHTYAPDTGPGQTNGQGIEGKWFVATPSLTSSGSGSSSSAGGPTSSSYGGY
jgi:predicted lipoprotein with Yx(FWY)xxD motif